MPSDRDEQLARIYERGATLRRGRSRRLLAAGAGALVVLVLAGGALAVGSDRRDDTVVTADDSTEGTSPGPTTSSTSAPPTADGDDSAPADAGPGIAPPQAVGPPIAPAPTIPVAPEPTDPPPPPSTTLPPPMCRNSTDPACGPFYIDWALPNQPASISVTASPPSPRVGELVSFLVTIDDADGTGRFEDGVRNFSITGDAVWEPNTPYASSGGLYLSSVAIADGSDGEQYGPWDPSPWSIQEAFTAMFTTAGDHVIRYETEDPSYCSPDSVCPNVSSGELVVTVLP